MTANILVCPLISISPHPPILKFQVPPNPLYDYGNTGFPPKVSFWGIYSAVSLWETKIFLHLDWHQQLWEGWLMTMEFQGHGGITQGKGEGKIRKPSMVWYGYSRNRPIWVYPWRMSRMFNPEDFPPKNRIPNVFFTLTIKKTSTLYKLPVMKNSISSDGTGARGLGVGGWHWPIFVL